LTGEVTGAALTTLTWDPENRLLSYASTEASESYSYSQDGLHKSKTRSSGETVFTWDGQNVFLETTTGGVVQARYTDQPEMWGLKLRQWQNGYTNFCEFDSQGTTRFSESTQPVPGARPRISCTAARSLGVR
jgi:YD repeat-containing protein